MKKILAIISTLFTFTGCSIFKNIPENITIPYNCYERFKITSTVSISSDCHGTDSLFIGKDTIILVANPQ